MSGIKATENGQFVYQERIEESVGGQLWLSTPVNGLRLGLATQAWALADTTTGVLLQGSVEADLNRIVLRGEGMRVEVEDAVTIETFYVQAGLRLIKQLELNGQYEFMDMTQLAVPVPGGVQIDYLRDAAIGVNYGLAANIRFKLEGHRVKGVGVEWFRVPV